MSQETFNKIIMIVLLVFFMIMYMISFVTGKPLDLKDLLGFFIPMIAHVGHMLYNLTNNKISVKAASNGTDTNKLKDIKSTLATPLPIGDNNNGSTTNSN